MKLTGETEVLGDKPVPVPFCPLQIPHVLTRDRVRASAVGGRRLTALAMARPTSMLFVDHCIHTTKRFVNNGISINFNQEHVNIIQAIIYIYIYIG